MGQYSSCPTGTLDFFFQDIEANYKFNNVFHFLTAKEG